MATETTFPAEAGQLLLEQAARELHTRAVASYLKRGPDLAVKPDALVRELVRLGAEEARARQAAAIAILAAEFRGEVLARGTEAFWLSPAGALGALVGGDVVALLKGFLTQTNRGKSFELSSRVVRHTGDVATYALSVVGEQSLGDPLGWVAGVCALHAVTGAAPSAVAAALAPLRDLPAAPALTLLLSFPPHRVGYVGTHVDSAAAAVLAALSETSQA